MRLRSILLVALLARPAAAQAPDTSHRAPGAIVGGVVRDSIARMPLAGAMVQLVAADSPARFGRTVISDSLGRFTFDDVPDGRYALGFFHPMLDSLGLEPTLREVYVDGRRPVRADLAIPSPVRLRAAVCGPESADSGAVVVGIVRDARDRAPAAGAKVTAEWLELSVSREGLGRRIPRLFATTGQNGWFALCNVPRPGTIVLLASRGADSTDLVEVQVPADGFLRRELYLGPARALVTGDTTPSADTLAPPPGRRRTGDGRLSGTVVAAIGGRPLAGARVGIPDGPQTRANDQGEWTLVGAPLGTRMLEVRAIGYYPERRAVDVVVGAAPIRTALSTMKAVLDTVMVRASRLNDPHVSGFAERRRTGMGRYLTEADVARRNPIVTSDVFRALPGLYVDRVPLGGSQVTMRGLFEARCSPAVYLDGHYMRDLGADEINDWVNPNEVAGIEIYAPGSVPPQFQPGLIGCGSIVIWTKPRPAPPRRRP